MVHTVHYGTYSTLWYIQYTMVHTVHYGTYSTLWYIQYTMVHTVHYGTYSTLWYIQYTMIHTYTRYVQVYKGSGILSLSVSTVQCLSFAVKNFCCFTSLPPFHEKTFTVTSVYSIHMQKFAKTLSRLQKQYAKNIKGFHYE